MQGALPQDVVGTAQLESIQYLLAYCGRQFLPQENAHFLAEGLLFVSKF
jgi:hypothetical protein